MAAPASSSLVVDVEAFRGKVDHPLFREAQLAEIRSCFSGRVAEARPLHAWIHGPPGTGKTLCVRFLLDRHVPQTAAVPLYVNCRERFTCYAVIECLLDQLKPLRSPQKSRERQLSILRNMLAGRRSVIALDEIDVLPIQDAGDLLHHLCVLPRTAVLCVASSRQLLLDLPDAARSRLAPRQILFPRYQPAELRHILATQLERALRPGSWTAETLRNIVDHAYGDARRALILLRHAVQRAEEASAEQLRPEHLVASNYDHDPHASDVLAHVSEHHRLLYELVRTRGPLAGTLLEPAYREACASRTHDPVATRTLVKYLGELCRRGILRRERGVGTSGWIYTVARGNLSCQ